MDGSCLGEEWTGYLLKIAGGQDKDGFPMKQGVLTNTRVRLLMAPGDPCFRGYGRRKGERRRKSVRGCVVGPDLSVMNLIVVKRGKDELPGLTDTEQPRMRGPKRASNIRKLFNLDKEDDLRQMVKKSYRREFEKDGKKHSRCPKIQRLVTPATLQRKRHKRAVRRRRIETKQQEAAEYHKLLMEKLKEQRERRSESLAKKRAMRQASQASKEA